MKDKINNFVACKIKNYVNKLKFIFLIVKEKIIIFKK